MKMFKDALAAFEVEWARLQPTERVISAIIAVAVLMVAVVIIWSLSSILWTLFFLGAIAATICYILKQ